jgi:hypothetical protein
MFAAGAFSELPESDIKNTTFWGYVTSNLSVSRGFNIYAATTEFTTQSTDTLASQPFFGTLAQPISFVRTLLGGTNLGTFTAGTGELDLTNTDGQYDFLIQGLAIDGRNISVKIGRPSDPYNNFYTVFSGTASDWSVEEDLVKIFLIDNSYRLGVTLQPNLYGGTGGSDGGTDLFGKRKPRAFGYVNNVSPPCVVPASLIYQVHDGSVSAITAVYDRGSVLTFSADYATYALLAAATIAAGHYGTCLAQGYFRLNTAPTGTITADVSGDNTGGVFASTSTDIVRRIVSTTGTVGDPSGLYLPSFISVLAAQPAPIGYWVAPDSTNTIADALANIMGAIGGWAGFRRSGLLDVGIVYGPSGRIPNAMFDRTDIFEISRDPLPTSLSPPPYRQRCAYQHNWTVQTDIAGSVGATRTSFLAQADRYSESVNTNVLLNHPFAIDQTPVASYFLNQSDAQAESDRLLALFSKNAALYRFKVGYQPFALDLGDVVNVTYPRWDLTVGKNLQVLEFTEDAQAGTIEMVGYG